MSAYEHSLMIEANTARKNSLYFWFFSQRVFIFEVIIPNCLIFFFGNQWSRFLSSGTQGSDLINNIFPTRTINSSVSRFDMCLVFTLHSKLLNGSESIAYGFLPSMEASTNDVPEPAKQSRTLSPGFVKFLIAQFGISGINLAGYLKIFPMILKKEFGENFSIFFQTQEKPKLKLKS